jgi:hypothetical protein
VTNFGKLGTKGTGIEGEEREQHVIVTSLFVVRNMCGDSGVQIRSHTSNRLGESTRFWATPMVPHKLDT